MGYQASGDGFIVFKGEIEHKTLSAMTDMLVAHFSRAENQPVITQAGHPDAGCSIIEFSCAADEFYHGEDLAKDLDEIARMAKIVGRPIKCGEIEFTGDDDICWRFIYKGDKWREEQGRIEYGEVTAEEVIAAFADYVNNDLEAADPDYVRMALEACCSEKIVKAIGFDYLYEKEEA